MTFSRQAVCAGNTAASKSSARKRCNGGGTFLPPRCRNTASARVTFQRQRTVNIGTAKSACSSSDARVAAVEHAEHLLDRKAVLRPEREHDAVVVGAGLQFEIEAAAESLPHRQPPGAVDPRPNGAWITICMPPDSSKNRSKTILPLRGHDADRRLLRRNVSAPLAAAAQALAPHSDRSQAHADCRNADIRELGSLIVRAGVTAFRLLRLETLNPRRQLAPQFRRPPRPTARWFGRALRRARRGRGRSGVRVLRRRLRRRARERIRHDMLPSRKMSPAWLSMAKSSLSVPTNVPSSSVTTR